MARGGDWRRFQRNRTIQRKAEILRGIGGEENVKAWTGGGCLGVLSKNKIHCSCWICRVKSYDYLSQMDTRRIQGMADEEREWQQNEGTDQENDLPLIDIEPETKAQKKCLTSDAVMWYNRGMEKQAIILTALVVLLIMNTASFALMGYDKRCARQGKWRVPERRLFLVTACF